MFYAQNHGIQVPDQLAVAGFEDNPFSRHTWPRLTTARQNINAIAQRAAELLFEEISPGRYDIESDARRNRFEPKLVVRDSTTPSGRPKTADAAG